MAGTLFLVSTPIGNLEDITVRALRVLRDADVIAAEDTRRTGRLLAHHGIATPTVSFHEHNTRSRIPQLIRRLGQGEAVALVTDAGTPSVSDPGLELVQACIDEQIPIEPIPGASAPLTAAVVSGFPLSPWTVFGFPPSRSKDRTVWLKEVSAIEHTVVFFEAPHRVRATLEEAAHHWGKRPIMIGRELTKAHQEFLRGDAAELAVRLVAPKGEFTVVLGPKPQEESQKPTPSDQALAEEFWHMTNSAGSGRRAAINAVAKRHGIPARNVYVAIERQKSIGYTPE